MLKFNYENFNFDQQRKSKHSVNLWSVKLMIVFTVTGRSFAKSYPEECRHRL